MQQLKRGMTQLRLGHCRNIQKNFLKLWKNYTAWPGDQAKDYLRCLIIDNRDGERAGCGKAVLSEILLLIALLDTRQDFN